MKIILSSIVLLFLLATTVSSAIAQQQQSASGVCSGPEAYWIADGRDYRGTVAVTRSGIPCQNWDSQTPHAHSTLMDQSIGLGNHNYCRNPSPESMSGPWCYTASPSVLFEYCNVGLPCVGDTHSQKTAPVTFSASSSSSTTSSSSGEIISPAVISLACDTFNATIYYTMDNDVSPSMISSSIYDSNRKIVIVGSGYVTVKAFALRPGFQPSEITSVTYNILPPSLPKVDIFPSSGVIDKKRPVLVTLSLPAASSSESNDNSILEIRYRIIEGSQADETTVITQQNSILYKSTKPFWVRSSATVIAASFIPEALIQQQQQANNGGVVITRAPSPMARMFYNLQITKASPPSIAPTPVDADTAIQGYGRVVFILQAADIESPTFQVCNLGVPVPDQQQVRSTFTFDNTICQDISTTQNAYHLTTIGTTALAFRVYGTNLAPSDFVFVTATVFPMPDVHLSVPSQATYVGPVDISGTCATTYTFLVNGEVRIPPIVLSSEGSYTIEAYSKTVFDQGSVTRASVTIESSNLPKPIFVPQPSTDVPSADFVFASPLAVELRPLSYLAGHASFNIAVYKLDATTGARVSVPSMSHSKLPTNVSTKMIFEAIDGAMTTYVVVATTTCNAGSSDCTLVNQSTTTEISYKVSPTSATSSSTASSPTFLLRVIDGISPSAITEERILSALFSQKSTTTSSGFSISVKSSGNNVFIQLKNLPSRLLVQYTSWLVDDLSSASRTARSAALRLRLGAESPSSSPIVSVDSASTNVGCLSSTSLSKSLATIHLGSSSTLFTVSECRSFCFNRFPTKASIISVLSPADRCDCLDVSSFDQPSSSSSDSLSDANFVSDSSLCNLPCGGENEVCGGTVADPAKYGLWSSTVCSAYLSFASPSKVQVYPTVSSWELVKADGIPYSDNTKNQKYSSTTTSILTMKMGLKTGSTPALYTNEGLVVLIKKTETSSCATDAAPLLFTSSSTSSYNNQLLLGFASVFNFENPVTSQDMVLSTVGDYRVCVSFPQQFFGDNKTFVEVTNLSPSPSSLEIIQGQYYPVYVTPKPGTYYAVDKMTINVSTTTLGASLKISIDGSQPPIVISNSSWTLITLTGAGTHTIVATAMDSEKFSGSPVQAVYTLVPQPTINEDTVAAYLSSARYSFSTTSIGSVRVSLSQYGKVQAGNCNQCRIHLLPSGSDCNQLNDENFNDDTLGPYASGTLELDAFSSSTANGKVYVSSEMMLSAPMSQDPIIVCVGGPPWYEIISTVEHDVTKDESKILSVASVGVGFCNNQDKQDAMCASQVSGARCSHVSFSGIDEYGCFCPNYLTKHYTSLFCNNNSKLPKIWNGSTFDVDNFDGSYDNTGTGNGNNNNSDTAIQASWGVFFVLVISYALSLGALWYHKTYRSKPVGENENDIKEQNEGPNVSSNGAVAVEMNDK